MQKQIPTNNIVLFSGLVGFASRFVLTEKLIDLPNANDQLSDPLYNLDFSNQEASIIIKNQNGTVAKCTFSKLP